MINPWWPKLLWYAAACDTQMNHSYTQGHVAVTCDSRIAHHFVLTIKSNTTIVKLQSIHLR